MKTSTTVHRSGREEITLRLGDDERPREERPSPRKVQSAPAPEREPEAPEAEAAEALDRLTVPGAALNILRAAAQAERAWREWSERSTVKWPQGRPPTLREIPALCYSTPPDFGGFVASCPREVIPFLAGSFYIAVGEARRTSSWELRRPLRESLAAIIPKGKTGTPHGRRASRIYMEVRFGRPLAEVAEMFGVSIQTIRSTVSAERRRRGLSPLRKREK